MATAGISENRIYTDEPAVPAAEPFKVRARLTTFELLALAAVIGVCFSVIAFEYGYRRPARAAAEAAAQARQVARTSASPVAPPRLQAAPRVADVAPAPATAPPVEPQHPLPALADPTSVASSTIAAAPPRPARADDPFQTPGTIYRCRRYDGSLFWSSLHCAKHRGALIDRIASVPADQPFDVQVRVASDEARRFEAAMRAEQAELQRMNTCASLVGEQAQILRRAGDVTVLTQVHTADRARAREIDAALQRLRCNG